MRRYLRFSVSVYAAMCPLAKAQWVNGPGDRRIRCEQDDDPDDALAARVAELLNRHGLTDGES